MPDNPPTLSFSRNSKDNTIQVNGPQPDEEPDESRLNQSLVKGIDCIKSQEEYANATALSVELKALNLTLEGNPRETCLSCKQKFCIKYGSLIMTHSGTIGQGYFAKNSQLQ